MNLSMHILRTQGKESAEKGYHLCKAQALADIFKKRSCWISHFQLHESLKLATGPALFRTVAVGKAVAMSHLVLLLAY
jgi:hypothetical protein